MQKIKLLLVEDEAVLAQVVAETLAAKGFETVIAANGIQGWNKYNSFKPDICVVDIMMPYKSGISLAEDIRKIDESTPIIFLTAKSQTADVLLGLEAGADDYIKKPFSMEELILRIKSLVRRSNIRQLNASEKQQNIFNIGDYLFNFTRLELIYDNQIINLSQKEGDLLKMLLDSKNALLLRKTALIKIWGDDNFFNARSMDVFISKLRRYLSKDGNIQILNVRGQGYKLVD